MTKGRLITVNSVGLNPSGGRIQASVTMTVYQQPTGAPATGSTSTATTTTAAP
jgi:hypothetical protein